METGAGKIKEDEIYRDWSFENLNTSVSQEMAVNSFYNVTPIESEVNHIGENSRTQSSITLTDGTIMNNLSSASRFSVNVRIKDTKDYVTNNSVHASGFLKEIVENIYNNSLIDTPQILFNAPKSKHKKIRKNTLKPSNRKSHRIARLVTYYIRHHKYKHPEKFIPRKFKKYYDKTRRYPANRIRIQQNLFAKSVIKVSRSTILKKVLAKENLFNEVDTIKSNDIQQHTVLETDPSEDTLTKIISESSHNDSSIHTETQNSVVEIPKRKSVTKTASNHSITLTNGTPDLSNQSHEHYYDNDYRKYRENSYTEESIHQSSFKTKIEVALVLNDESTLKYTKNNSSEQCRQEMLYKENLTSAESFMSESDIFNITSSPDTSKTDTQNMNLSKNGHDKICIVINDAINTFNNTSNSDTFVNAETSSRFRNTFDSIDMSSEQTLTSELTNQTSPCNIYFQPNRKAEAETALLDETISLKPDKYSSNGLSTDNYLTNNIIITDELRRIPFAIRELTADKNIRNVIQKSFSVDNDGDRPKNINLPNEDTIRSILEAEGEKKSCSELFRNLIPQADVLDKLIAFLDTAIRRLEDSLLKRIGNEIKNTLDKFEKLLPLMDEHAFVKSDIKFESNDDNKIDLSRLESGGLTVLEENVQCVLVKNEIIDELTKMKIEGETNAECPVQVTESKVIKNEDSFKILKPVKLCKSVREQGDSYMTSSSEGVRVKRLSKKSSLLSYLAVPMHFIKTNILVLTSVPAFFMSIFLLYSFFLLLV